jgi:hypothetical protein
MSVVRLAALCLIALMSVAHADTTVSVVVSGAESIKKDTRDTAEQWLEAHDLRIPSEQPLAKDGLNSLLNCLVISDMTCARGVVEVRGKVGNIIAITGQVTGKKEKRSIQLAAYWIAKDQEVVSLQKTCNACTDVVFTSTLNAMLDDLAKLAPTMRGKIHVTSKPSRMNVTVDNEEQSTTPFDRELSFGPHTLSIVRDGRVIVSTKIEVKPQATLEVPLIVPEEKKEQPQIKIVEAHRSRAVPVLLLTVGIAATATGAVLYNYGGPTGVSYTYRNMRPAGIATAISGGVAVIVGTVWLLKTGNTTSKPEVSMTSNSATVGWARSF